MVPQFNPPRLKWMMLSNTTEPFRKRGQTKPPQYYGAFYYLLDFDRSRFYILSQLGDKDYQTPDPSIVMIPLGSDVCREWRFYHIDIVEFSSYFCDGRGYTKIKPTIKEEISRNEFFSQYALGTLEGTFIATRDVKHLRKYLVKDK